MLEQSWGVPESNCLSISLNIVCGQGGVLDLLESQAMNE